MQMNTRLATVTLILLIIVNFPSYIPLLFATFPSY